MLNAVGEVLSAQHPACVLAAAHGLKGIKRVGSASFSVASANGTALNIACVHAMFSVLFALLECEDHTHGSRRAHCAPPLYASPVLGMLRRAALVACDRFQC